MRAINHALTGAVIGLVLPPALALPAAPLSHFALDAIPHFGVPNQSMHGKFFAFELVVDAVLCAALVIVLGVAAPHNWWLAAVCAFLAAGVDFMWIPRYLKALKTKRDQLPTGWLFRFHDAIQHEFIGGIFVELVWAAAMLVLLRRYI